MVEALVMARSVGAGTTGPPVRTDTTYSLTGIWLARSVDGMDATTFAALGEPSRLQIVELLRIGPSSVGDIAQRLGIRQPQTSKHLGALRDAGIVDVEPVARHRIYHLREEPFAEIGGWLDSFEEVWDARLDSLGAFLRSRDTSTAGAPGAARKGTR